MALQSSDRIKAYSLMTSDAYVNRTRTQGTYRFNAEQLIFKENFHGKDTPDLSFHRERNNERMEIFRFSSQDLNSEPST